MNEPLSQTCINVVFITAVSAAKVAFSLLTWDGSIELSVSSNVMERESCPVS